jgi:hypothetical protein
MGLSVLRNLLMLIPVFDWMVREMARAAKMLSSRHLRYQQSGELGTAGKLFSVPLLA